MTNDTFLSCDWGTSNFRLRWIRSVDLKVLGEISNSDGIAQVFGQWKNEPDKYIERSDFFGNRLADYIGQLEKQLNRSLEGNPLLLSGMASSSIGLKELPYKRIPLSLKEDQLNFEKIVINKIPGIPVFLVSGICSENDVIRGEETLLIGANEENKIDSIVYIFPGTHSKHLFVEHGVVKGFKTFMTGEMFKLLSQHSILADSIESNEPFEKSAFQKGVREGASFNILNSIFHVRTNQVFKINSAQANYHYLSGLLIGYELSDLLQYKPKDITLICSETLKEQYLSAFEMLGDMNVKFMNADAALVEGHRVLMKRL